MLPHVIRFNSQNGQLPYSDLATDPQALTRRIEVLLAAANIPRRLSDLAVDQSRIPDMAEMAAKQWTAQFNPRPVTTDDFARLYRAAM